MTASRVDLLIRQLDIAWALFEHHLQRLDDAAAGTGLLDRPPGRPGPLGGWLGVPAPELSRLCRSGG